MKKPTIKLLAVIAAVTISMSAAKTLQAQDNKAALLQNLGFDMTPPATAVDGSNANPYGNGLVFLAPQYELYMNNGGNNERNSSLWEWDQHYAHYSARSLQSYPDGDKFHVRSYSANLTGSGKPDYLVEICADFALQEVKLVVRKGSSLEQVGNAVPAFTLPGFAYVKNGRQYTVEPWEMYSVLSAAVGDFNGDEKDEIAVYNPVDETIDVYGFDVGSNQLVALTTGIAIPRLTNTADRADFKDYYSVALAAGDLNGDNIADLAITVNRHNGFRNQPSADAYATLAILHATPSEDNIGFTAVQSTDFSDNTFARLKFRNTSGDYANSDRTLRAAGVAIGDINGDGQNEVVVVGLHAPINDGDNYSRLTYYYEAATWFTGDGILGKGSLDAGTGYLTDAFAIYRGLRKEFNLTNYSFIGCAPLAVTTYKGDGRGAPETIWSAGIGAKFNDDGNLIIFHLWINDNGMPLMQAELGFNTNHYNWTNIWYSEAVAGNFDGNPDGREDVMSVVGACTQNHETYGSSVFGISNYYAIKRLIAQEGNRHNISITPTFVNNKSLAVRYKDKSFYFTNPNILAVLQAAPSFGELQDYEDRGGTAIARSTGQGSSEVHSVSGTAGVVAGYDLEASLFGAFKTGLETTFKLTANFGGEWESAKEITHTIEYSSNGNQDRVVASITPYTKYNYDMYVPETTMPTEVQYNGFKTRYNALKTDFNPNSANALAEAEEMGELARLIQSTDEMRAKGYAWGATLSMKTVPYSISFPSEPRTQFMTVDVYDNVARDLGYETIRDNVLPQGYQWGKPETYRSNTDGLKVVVMGENAGSDNPDVWSYAANTGDGGSTTRSIETSESSSHSLTWGVGFESENVAKVGGAKLGYVLGANYEGGHTWSKTSGAGYSGSVTDPPISATEYGFSWNFFAHKARLQDADVFVLEYLIQNIAPIKIEATPLTVTAPVEGETPSVAVTNYNIQFDVEMEWDGNPATFASNTAYTATFTLTSAHGNAFRGYINSDDIVGFAVNGIPPTFVSNDGYELVFKVTFPRTGILPLTFTYNAAYNIPASSVGVDIAPVDFTAAVMGGTAPYSISNVIGLPDGLEYNGLIISGAPATPGTGGTMTVIVADADGNLTSMEITYGNITARVQAVPLSILAPVVGEPATTFIDHNGRGFAATLAWNTTTFTLNSWYEATITLTAEANYNFSSYMGNASIAGFSVNGVSPTYQQLADNDTKLVFTVNMQAVVAPVNAATPVIVSLSNDTVIIVNSPLTLQVEATVSDGGTLSYQWYRVNPNGTNRVLPDGTNATYDMPPVPDEGSIFFRVAVTNTNTNSEITGETTITISSWIITVTGVAEQNFYTVTFNENYGDEPAITQIYILIEEGETAVIGELMPDDPTREGYIFAGWFTDNGTFQNQWDFETDAVTQDTTLWAQWSTTIDIETITNDELGITIYPNPAKDELRIESGGLVITKLSIVDLSGRVVSSQSFTGKSVNVSTLTQGVYFVRIETDKGVVTKKFIKE